MSSGRFNKLHPEAHRVAIVTNVIDRGVSQRKTIKMALAGELPDCEAFKVSNGTVCNWVAAERRARMPNTATELEEHGPEAMLAAARMRLATMLERDLTKAENAKQRDPRDLERLAVAASRIASMQASPTRNGKGEGAEDNEQGEGPSPLVETLTSAASTNTSSTSSTTTNQQQGERGPSTTPREHDPAPAQAA